MAEAEASVKAVPFHDQNHHTHGGNHCEMGGVVVPISWLPPLGGLGGHFIENWALLQTLREFLHSCLDEACSGS